MDNKNKRPDHGPDGFLDDALADYSNVEPRSGLENRILARLSAAEAGAPKAWLRWWPAVGFAGVAAIALIIFLALPRATSKPHQVVVKKTPERSLVPSKTSPQPQVAANRQRAPHAPVRTLHEQAPSPPPPQFAVVKQDVFPAPSPLTEQERLLFTYLRRTAASEIAANAKPDVPPALEQQINQIFPDQRNADSNTNTK